jgi:hypothetical protein
MANNASTDRALRRLQATVLARPALEAARAARRARSQARAAADRATRFEARRDRLQQQVRRVTDDAPRRSVTLKIWLRYLDQNGRPTTVAPIYTRTTTAAQLAAANPLAAPDLNALAVRQRMVRVDGGGYVYVCNRDELTTLVVGSPAVTAFAGNVAFDTGANPAAAFDVFWNEEAWATWAAPPPAGNRRLNGTDGLDAIMASPEIAEFISRLQSVAFMAISVKRTGPDLARVGGKYSDDWHRDHLINPRALVPESIMPPYAFLAGRTLDLSTIQDQMRTLQFEGVPYTTPMIDAALDNTMAQAGGDYDVEALRKSYDGIAGRDGTVPVRNFDGVDGAPTELDALIAYLQMLGTLVDFKTYEAGDLSNRR